MIDWTMWIMICSLIYRVYYKNCERKLVTILNIKIGDFHREKFQEKIFVFLEDNREIPLYRGIPVKQHFSNRHSVPLISKRTLLSYFSLFPFRFTQLLHAPSFLLPFRRVSLPFDVPNYHPSTNFLLLFHSFSLFFVPTMKHAANKRSKFSIANRTRNFRWSFYTSQ